MRSAADHDVRGIVADEREEHYYTPEDAKRLIQTLTHKLGLEQTYIQPAFEDTFYYLWRERTLPVNVDPFDSRLEDEMERARLRRVFSNQLDVPVGYTLPLATTEGEQAKVQRWLVQKNEVLAFVQAKGPEGGAGALVVLLR